MYLFMFYETNKEVLLLCAALYKQDYCDAHVRIHKHRRVVKCVF